VLFKGVAASPGVGLGRVVIYKEPDLNYRNQPHSGQDNEKARLKQAIEKFKIEISKLVEEAEAKAGPQQAAILTGQITMLTDPFMISQMEELIEKGLIAEAAMDEVTQSFQEMFENVEDEKMRQRATDIGDLRKRLLRILLGVEQLDLTAIEPDSIVVAIDLPASVITALPLDRVQALVTEIGGYTSHGSIMARALGVPAVTSLTGLMDSVKQDGLFMIADGSAGEVIIDPDEQTLARYRQRQHEWQNDQASLKVFIDRQTVDADGVKRTLEANIGGMAEAKIAQAAGADGVGLFRTEFLFLNRNSLPGEEEQFRVYSEVASLFPNREVIIRTLDVGGDKPVPALGLPKEENPFLGYRAIRYCLDQPEVFSIQLRAILRAGATHGNIKIMLPLVTSLEEVIAAKKILDQCAGSLASDGRPYDASIKLGVMIETPAAVQIVDLLATEADFFSIGTNDLAQYTLAADRGNPKVGALCSPFHPAVLRSIQTIIKAGQKASVPVGLCGEVGSNPQMIPILMAFGLDKISVSPSSLAMVRRELSTWRLVDARELTEQVMSQTSANAVKQCINAAFERKSLNLNLA
jgi:phosphotransferase system enzyme I (PtsI)